ncbi:MAG: geranylgeranyl reductase family protein [Anaerolineae bacterium]|nr:geranylgeranyl reductase family protein [Anaerolineae bacterium]
MNADVIIVGGGPGGSVAAAAAVQKGLKVLLLDRAEFPRDKVCGDAVAAHCFDLLRELGMEPFTDPAFYKIDQFNIRGPRGISLTFKLSESEQTASCIVPRYVFDNALFQFAIKSGAEFQKASVASLIVEHGQVVGVKAKVGKQEAEFRAPVVIGADGAASVVARDLNSRQPREDRWAVALRAYIDTEADLDRTIDFVFLDKIQPGYAWLFPIAKRRANIGVGMRSDFYKKQNKSLNEALDYYLSTPVVRKLIGSHTPENVKSWSLPIFSFELKRVFNGALLVGDAGGFVTPLAGAGIHTAVVTGLAAAEAAARALKTGDVSEHGLASYDALWKAELAADMRRELAVHDVLAFIPGLIDAFLLAARAVPPLVPRLLGKI